MNLADESSQKLDYMMTEQNKKCHKNAKKSCESSFKQFQLIFIQNNNSSLISVEDKLTFWQIDDLISILVNKLATAVFETDE